jgi:hypothetical protein
VIAYLDNMNATPLKKSKGPACLRAAIITSVGFSMLAPFAQAATWDGGGSDTNWSTTLNWSDDASPAGQAVLFDNTAGLTSGPTVAGNNVDSSLTLDSLSYANTGTSGSVWQVTQISGGQTLTLDSASIPPSTIFSVGGVAFASTRVAILGAGTFTINEATSSIAVGGPTANQSAVLDMSGLAVFNATVATVNFGASRANGDVMLANTNTITATTFNVGNVTSSTGSNSKSDLLLGTTNTINADTINVGVNYASGTIRFQSGLTSPTVTIRGSAGGTSRADLTIANTVAVGSIGNAQGSSVDLTDSGGSVDARIGTLLIGRRGDSGANTTYTGSLAMDKGSIDATTVVLGQSAGAGLAANSVTAGLSVGGGTFNAGTISMADNAAGATSVTANLNVSGTAVVTVAGNVVAGSQSGTATTVAANINVSSGKLVIHGDLAEGTNPSGVASTVNLSGGTLDMDHGSIAVDTVNFTAGTLKNVASFAAGAGLDVQNASTLAYDVDGAFTSTVLTGTLTLGAGANLELSLATGFVPTGDLLLVANDGSESIVGTFATINGEAFDEGSSFTLTNNTGSYVFTLNYAGGTGNDLVAQLSAVPEPAAYAVLVGGAMMVLAIGRRRRRH